MEQRAQRGPDGEYSGRDEMKILFFHLTEDITISFNPNTKEALVLGEGTESVGWTGPFPYQYNQSTGAISFDPTFLKAQLHTLLKTMPAHIHVPAHLNPETVDSYIEHLRVSYNAAADSVHVQIDGIPIVKSTQFDLCHSQNCVTHTNSPRPSSSH